MAPGTSLKSPSTGFMATDCVLHGAAASARGRTYFANTDIYILQGIMERLGILNWFVMIFIIYVL